MRQQVILSCQRHERLDPPTCHFDHEPTPGAAEGFLWGTSSRSDVPKQQGSCFAQMDLFLPVLKVFQLIEIHIALGATLPRRVTLTYFQRQYGGAPPHFQQL